MKAQAQLARTQVCTLMDEHDDYPTAGQRMRASPPEPTAHTQLSESTQSTSAPLVQPTQQADLFQQQLHGMDQAARQQSSDSPASISVDHRAAQLATTAATVNCSDDHTSCQLHSGTTLT